MSAAATEGAAMDATQGTAAARAYGALNVALELEHAAFVELTCEISDLTETARQFGGDRNIRQLMAIYQAARGAFVSAARDAREVLKPRQ